ncbi:MAG: hypothetical protein ACK5LX_01145 [Oscillospiraceae bacterium]
MTKNKGCMVYITTETAKELDKIKRNDFYNASKSEMLREIIRLGIAAHKDKDKKDSA